MNTHVVLSCGCIWDSSLEGKPHGCDPGGVPANNHVYVQGRCREIADAAYESQTDEAIAEWSKNFDRHVKEIGEYKGRQSKEG